MKYGSCLICGKDEPQLLLVNKKDPFLKRIGLSETRYVVCKQCGFVYQNPKLDEQEIERLYSKSYYDEQHARVTEAYKIKKEEYAKHSFEWISSKINVPVHAHDSNILDIGSNTGAFLSLFKKNGWNCFGVEPSQNMSTIAKERYGLEQIFTQLFERGMFASSSFSFVSLLHTLEHLENPAIILKDIHDVLQSDGYLYVEVPDIFHPKSAFYTSYFATPHLYVFSQYSLQRLLATHGFATIFYGTLPRGIGVLAKKTHPFNLSAVDDPKEIRSLIVRYKKEHDCNVFLYQHIANSMPARVIINLRIPVISKAYSRFRERVRVNKII